MDGDIGRKDSNAVLNYLREKYGIPDLINLQMTFLSGTMSILDPQDED